VYSKFDTDLFTQSLTHRYYYFFFFLILRPPPSSTLFPYTTLFRSECRRDDRRRAHDPRSPAAGLAARTPVRVPGCIRRQESADRSEEHTSELQSPCNLVCRLLLEKKKKKIIYSLLDVIYD